MVHSGSIPEHDIFLHQFSNSVYVGDPVSRKSISGFILYVLGVLISWQSKGQKSVTLSSSEAAWVI